MRGVPETNYGEIKKNASFSLTPTALLLLKAFSKEVGISTSELIERFARLEIALKDNLREELSLQKPFEVASEVLNKA